MSRCQGLAVTKLCIQEKNELSVSEVCALNRVKKLHAEDQKKKKAIPTKTVRKEPGR